MKYLFIFKKYIIVFLLTLFSFIIFYNVFINNIEHMDNPKDNDENLDSIKMKSALNSEDIITLKAKLKNVKNIDKQINKLDKISKANKIAISKLSKDMNSNFDKKFN